MVFSWLSLGMRLIKIGSSPLHATLSSQPSFWLHRCRMDGLHLTPPLWSTGEPQVVAGTVVERETAVKLSIMGRELMSLMRQPLTIDKSWFRLMLLSLCLKKSSLYLGFKSFLDELSKLWDYMHDYSRLCKLAYDADILAHLNKLHWSWEGGLSCHRYSTLRTTRWLQGWRGSPGLVAKQHSLPH